MEITKSQAEYLNAIYNISKLKKATVTNIADKLNFSKPSVVRALKSLSDDNFIIYNDIIKLTDKGLQYAKNINRKDDVLNNFLINILKIDAETAKKDSDNMKLNVSCYTIKKLEDYMSDILKEIPEKNNYCICEYEKCDSCKKEEL